MHPARVAYAFIDDLANAQGADVRRQGLGHIVGRAICWHHNVGGHALHVITRCDAAHGCIDLATAIAARDDEYA